MLVGTTYTEYIEIYWFPFYILANITDISVKLGGNALLGMCHLVPKMYEVGIYLSRVSYTMISYSKINAPDAYDLPEPLYRPLISDSSLWLTLWCIDRPSLLILLVPIVRVQPVLPVFHSCFMECLTNKMFLLLHKCDFKCLFWKMH